MSSHVFCSFTLSIVMEQRVFHIAVLFSQNKLEKVNKVLLVSFSFPALKSSELIVCP